MKKTLLYFVYSLLPTAYCLLPTSSYSQQDSSSSSQNAIYNRPFISLGKTNTAVGGYLEGNTNYFSEDGVTEGFSMELRRFNIFLYSRIHERIKFISELEFEHGTEEIALETALLDFEFHPAFNLRAGILLPQIGLVNANHDSPKWDFVERPISSTAIIPTTLSEVGVGFHGKFFSNAGTVAYDVYLMNGLQDGIILNEEGRTHLASGKNPEMFGEDNNGVPMFNARLAFSNSKLGEIGLSWYGGVYNSFRLDGVEVDAKRKLSLTAFDLSTAIRKLKIQGELAFVKIQVPEGLEELYGTNQYGAFLELGHPILKKKMLGFEDAQLSVHLRAEKADFNQGTFVFDGSKIGDEVSALSFGLSWRPLAGSVIRANYRYHWIYDFFGNPPAHLGGIQVGIATYF